MKKLPLICIATLTCILLAACGNHSNKKAGSSSKVSSSKVVKHHHKKHNQKFQSSSVSSSSSVSQSSSTKSSQSSESSQPDAWSMQQQARNQAAQSGTPTSEDQARAMLGDANGDLQATRTNNGWVFSGNGYTATVGDDGSISHN